MGTRYRPNWQQRVVDVRAGQLQQEYVGKARAADRRDGVPQDEVGRVERKLASLGPIQGIVAGQFGEVSEATHSLLDALATSRVRFAGPSLGRRGFLHTEEGERAVAIASLRRRLGVMTVRCQASSLLGRVETLGPWRSCSRGEEKLCCRGRGEVEKGAPGSPAGNKGRVESAAKRLCQAGLNIYI